MTIPFDFDQMTEEQIAIAYLGYTPKRRYQKYGSKAMLVQILQGWMPTIASMFLLMNVATIAKTSGVAAIVVAVVYSGIIAMGFWMVHLFAKLVILEQEDRELQRRLQVLRDRQEWRERERVENEFIAGERIKVDELAERWRRRREENGDA